MRRTAAQAGPAAEVGTAARADAGALLRGWRQRALLTQEELAERAGVSARTIRRLESGPGARPHGATLRRLAEVLDLNDAERAALRGAVTAAVPAAVAEPGSGVRSEPGPAFRVLGPVQALHGERPIDLGPPSRQDMLVALLVDANEVVPVEELIERVGNGDPARRAALDGDVSRLRSALAGAGGADIVRESGGYRLVVDPAAVDLHRFRLLVGTARRTGGDNAAAAYEEALGLWRGEAFADLDSVWLDQVRAGLAEERRDAARDRIDLLIELGRHAEVLPELEASAAEHPLDERIAGQLVLALHRAGRRAEALQAYQAIRDALLEQLGLEPRAHLRELHERVLGGEPAGEPAAAGGGDLPPSVPRQLPGDVRSFTGREQQLARLHDLHGAGAAGARTPVVIAVDGTAGVGKTALAIHFAHRIADRFPDGQLYLDLRGHTSSSPMTAREALGQLLRGLGVQPERIPADEREMAARYRTALAGRHVLVVLDDARSDDQVRPLLPGGPESTVLITSRRMLTALDDVAHVHLDVLTEQEAHSLLAEPLGHDRTAAEPTAASAVVDMCARLPLALRLAGARLAARPTWSIATLADRLADENRRLGELVAGDRAVRAGFAVSYRSLATSDDLVDRAAARMFEVLGAADWVDVSVPAAAALLDAPETDAVDALERLVDDRMLDSTRPGRYHTHDLLRLYARELARAAGPDRDRVDDAVRRLLHCYLDAAGQANLLVNPITRHHPDPPAKELPGRFVLATHADARAWVETERENLIAVARQALDGPDEIARLAVELTAALNRPFDLLGYWSDFQVVRELAAATAHRLGDETSAAFAWTDIGWTCVRLGAADRAITAAQRALTVWRETGDARSEQACLNILGYALRQHGRLSDALECLETAYAICDRIGHRYGQAATLNHLGLVHQRLSRFTDAVRCHTDALAINRDLDEPGGEAVSLANLGWARHRAGEPGAALDHFHESRAVAHQVGDRYQEAEALWGLGEAQQALGDRSRAWAFWRRSIELLTEIGALDRPEADALARQSVPATPEVIRHNT